MFRHYFFSVLYALFQVTQGLLFHPYQTMQSLVRDKVFVWMTLLPTLVLAIVTSLWRLGVVPLVRLVFSCQMNTVWACDWLSFFSNWVTFFCIFWQIVLLYLLFRFSRVFKSVA